MPTVMSVSGVRVVIYPTDHRPAHVHAVTGDKGAVIVLNCPDGPPELDENYGFTGKQLAVILATIATNLGALCAHWHRIHGHA
jgi:Domain of unknown function (DUF4160)